MVARLLWADLMTLMNCCSENTSKPSQPMRNKHGSASSALNRWPTAGVYGVNECVECAGCAGCVGDWGLSASPSSPTTPCALFPYPRLPL